MALYVAEYVVRVAVELADGDDIAQFLHDAADHPAAFIEGNLNGDRSGRAPAVSVKLIRSGSKGNYAYTDPILAKASRRRAWKAIAKNRSDAAPDNTSLETIIVQGVAAAVGDEEAVAEANAQAAQEAVAVDTAETREAAAAAEGSDAVAEAGPAPEAVAAVAAEAPAEDTRPQ